MCALIVTVYARGGLLRRVVAVATVAIVDEMEDLRMRKLVSATVVGPRPRCFET